MNYEVDRVAWYNKVQNALSKYLDVLGDAQVKLGNAQKKDEKNSTTIQVALPYRVDDINMEGAGPNKQVLMGGAGIVNGTPNSTVDARKSYTADDFTIVNDSKNAGGMVEQEKALGIVRYVDPSDKKEKTFSNKDKLSTQAVKEKLATELNQKNESELSSDPNLNVNTSGLQAQITITQQKLDMLGSLQQQRGNKVQAAEQAKQQSLAMLTSIIKAVGDTSSAVRRNIG
ncbi:MAG: hypothetical protein EOO40_08990 [Deltaproteobacteria bacterium]|nr:MAG: hypothetical protein EOO40_08990 [Deltaproteobacteria bacterium]